MKSFTPSPQQRRFAKDLRSNQTTIEDHMWRSLRAGRLDGWKFKRQVPMRRYILDFVCFERRLIVEVDGPVHERELQKATDAARDDWLRGEGFSILRVTGDDILAHLDAALDRNRLALAR